VVEESFLPSLHCVDDKCPEGLLGEAGQEIQEQSHSTSEFMLIERNYCPCRIPAT